METEQNIIEEHLASALSKRYLDYAISTIVSRSLPDVRDGLKPVHRRLLWAMRTLHLDPKSGFKKCARVVGDVIGKYHPHGDVAVYDAMVRLAQDFAVRYPLVEGQGNFGNIDGDRAAAMRYTEARLTPAAMALMQGLDDNAVDFVPTYDGSDIEPALMPAAFPNLLANGASGIAVGMATNIPPHNISEVCDALIYLISHPDAETSRLMDFVHGPDFPTGGFVTEDPATLIRAYETGRGALRMRAKWEKEDLGHGQYQIVITEMPYQISKSDVVMKIAKLLNDKKLPLLADVRDESTQDVRLVLEPKSRLVDAQLLMEHMFQLTDLQTTFHLNMNVLDADGTTPRVMGLKAVLQAFLNHRHVVLKRCSAFRLDKIKRRMELLQGFLIAYLNLDKVIEIIRNNDEPKPLLMDEFKLTDLQSEAILNMRLRALRKLEEMQIKAEFEELNKERMDLERLLNDEALQWKTIAEQLSQTKKLFSQHTDLGRRRTQIVAAPQSVNVPTEALFEKEPITIILSKKGWIRSLKGHTGVADVRFKDGDDLQLALHAQTTDKIVLFATDGRFYTMMGGKIVGGRGFGEPIRLTIDLPEDEHIVAMFAAEPEKMMCVASAAGKGFLVQQKHLMAQTKTGKVVLTLDSGDSARFCVPATGDTVAVIGQNRKLLMFPKEEIPQMVRGRGVRLQKYQGGGLSDIMFFNKAEGFGYAFGNGTRVENDISMWLGHRAGVGKMPPTGFSRNNRFK